MWPDAISGQGPTPVTPWAAEAHAATSPRGGGPRDRHRRRRFRRPPPKLPPPEHGIRVQQIGGTWWGERWVEALLRMGRDYAARLHRGRSYARQGRVHDLTVARNVVRASVTGSRTEPYRVALALKPLPDRTWDQAIRAMAAKARFSTQLLAGEMPREIDQAFAAARASLFPLRDTDLRTKCTCPDWANPCKHVAALHYVLGEAFDRDPFLLFELRGRSKDTVLRGLRELRARAGGAVRDRAVERGVAAADDLVEPEPAPAPGVDAADAPVAFDTQPAGDIPSALAVYEAFRAPVDDLRFRITTPATEGATLRQLGPPPAWSIDRSLAELVQPVLARAASLARAVALETGPDASPESGNGAPSGRRGRRSTTAHPPR